MMLYIFMVENILRIDSVEKADKRIIFFITKIYYGEE